MLGGRRRALPPNRPPALRSLTLFGFVFVVVSCWLLYCSSSVVAGDLLLLVFIVAMVFVVMFAISFFILISFMILFLCYMVSYMMLFLVVFCCLLLFVCDFVVKFAW